MVFFPENWWISGECMHLLLKLGRKSRENCESMPNASCWVTGFFIYRDLKWFKYFLMSRGSTKKQILRHRVVFHIIEMLHQSAPKWTNIRWNQEHQKIPYVFFFQIFWRCNPWGFPPSNGHTFKVVILFFSGGKSFGWKHLVVFRGGSLNIITTMWNLLFNNVAFPTYLTFG